MSKIVGFDLGTGNSCACVFEAGNPVVIANSEGKRTTPSIVGFDKNGERKIGDTAKRQAITNPKNTIYEVKRLMGNSYDECSQEINRVSYEVVNENGQPRINVNDKKYSPEEISAMILQKMKQTAEDYLGTTVDKCVVTVPAYFNDTQRQATKNAAQIAGMECLRIINEPTAAALAYGLDKSDKDMKIAVFDSGSGTQDFSILEFGSGVFEVLATDGDTHLGGSDIDEKITNWVIEEFKNDEGIDVSNDPMALQRIKEASEKAKIELSSSVSTEINLPYLTANETGPKHFVKTITRAKFESLIGDIIKRMIEPCKTALKSAGLSINDIDEIILVGGSTRIPAVQKAVEDFFGKAPSHGVNPDEAVAMGAAIQGAILNGDENVGDIVLLDVVPQNLGIQTQNDILTTIVESNTTIPCKKTMTFSNAVDMQPEASIMVYSGNRPMAYQNKLLGQFNIEITPSPRGMNQIEVSFDIDANGILTVSAVDKVLNKLNTITIEASSNLTKEEIEQMKAEAEANADADKKLKEVAEKLNKADSMTFTINKTMNEMGDKIDDNDKSIVNLVIEKINQSLKEKNVSECEKYCKELEDKWSHIVQKIYQTNTENTASNSFNPQDIFNMTGQNTNAQSTSTDNFDESFEEIK